MSAPAAPEDLSALLRALDAGDDVQVRSRLLPHVPALCSSGLALWRLAFTEHTTRFNKYLFLNAPELWREMAAADWLAVMSHGVQREQRPQDFASSGRLDDLRLLHRWVGVDALQMFFELARPSLDDRRVVAAQLARTLDFLLPDEGDDELFDEDEVCTTRADLAAYRSRLQAQLPGLGRAAADREALRDRLAHYAGVTAK